MITVARSVIARLNGCVTVIYRSVSTYKQARSQEVRWVGGGGGGGGIDYESGGREVRQVPLAFSGPNTQSETPLGLMHFYKYHN